MDAPETPLQALNLHTTFVEAADGFGKKSPCLEGGTGDKIDQVRNRADVGERLLKASRIGLSLTPHMR
jgi:hypothetical protein